jgi:hypothetical protein
MWSHSSYQRYFVVPPLSHEVNGRLVKKRFFSFYLAVLEYRCKQTFSSVLGLLDKHIAEQMLSATNKTTNNNNNKHSSKFARDILVFQLCRSQWPRGLRLGSPAARLLGSWIRIPPGHGYLSVVCVLWCQVEVSATSWSLVQRSPTYCGASLCVITKPRERGGHSPRWAAEPEKIIIIIIIIQLWWKLKSWTPSVLYKSTMLFLLRLSFSLITPK